MVAGMGAGGRWESANSWGEDLAREKRVQVTWFSPKPELG